MSSRCLPSCEGMCPEPCAYTRGLGPSVASCRDSMAIVYGPPLYINFPGPKIYSCPQESIVGSSLPQPSAALSSSSSYGGMSGMGGSYGSGGSGMGGSYGSGGSYGGMSGMGGYSGCGGSYGSGGMSGRGGSSGSGGCYLRKFYTSSSRGSRLGN